MRPEILNFYFVPISKIRGIGPKLNELYLKMLRKRDIACTKDLLFHIPYSVIKRIVEPASLAEALNKQVIIKADILDSNISKTKFRRILKTRVKGKSGHFQLVFYNFSKAYLDSTLKEGETRIVIGKLEKYGKDFQIVHPRILSGTSNQPIIEVEPVYPLIAGITNTQLMKSISLVLSKISSVAEWIEENYIKQNRWSSFSESVEKIHNPESITDIDFASKYRSRIAYDELLASQLAIGLSRKKIQKKDGEIINSERVFAKKLLANLGFKLTDGQTEALKEIFTDLADSKRMFRLVQGDVGCGKTIVGALAMLQSAEAGFQSSFMAPTEILAKQQYDSLSDIISKAGLEDKIKITLLTGSIHKKEQERIRQGIEAGEVDFIVGTHSLFQEKVKFKNSGLVIIDEQHRFGVRQRMDLAEKGKKTNVLLMTATPIPRTLMMTFYGDMEVSTITDKPEGRQIIETNTVPLTKLEEVTNKLKSQIAEGKRIYWICPLVKDSEDEEDNSQENSLIENDGEKLGSAENRYESLKKIFKDKVGIVHGQMKAKDKDQAIEGFKEGKTSVLVSTTVIEVGVNIPEATVMIIENAERFGLSQLHQLRGRVGRGSEKSHCILLYSNRVSEVGRKRLKVMRDTNDGFKIAEEDLVLRGSGDLLGTKQSGLPDFKFAVLPEHKDLLFAARDDTKMILEKDPELKTERGKNLRNLLYLFEYDQQIKNLSA